LQENNDKIDRPPRLRRVYQRDPIFFVTFNTWNHQQLLASDSVHQALKAYCIRGIEMGRVWVGRYVIMPDHVHLFVRGVGEFDLGIWIRGLRRAMSKHMISNETYLWQDGFFDHVIRQKESFADKCEYVMMNPVRAGLVTSYEQWPFQGNLSMTDV
jgi:REP element-mobilizing transposase RayT